MLYSLCLRNHAPYQHELSVNLGYGGMAPYEENIKLAMSSGLFSENKCSLFALCQQKRDMTIDPCSCSLNLTTDFVQHCLTGL